MADNNDIKDFLEEAKAGKVPENAMDAQLEFLVGSGLDYDVETLRSLAGVVKGLPDDNKYKADLAKKIEEKLKSLENDANQPTGDKPNYDEKTSYNLKKEFEKALQEKDVETAKGIATYALDYVKRSQLTEKNAPTISDYYDILKKANVEIPEENLKKLEAALKAYDAQNNLADMKLSAEEYEANAEEWKKLMSKSKLLGEALPKFLPEDADEKLKKETFEAVQSAAITQLALKKPDENSEAAIKEKLAELLAVQAQTREFVIADIYNQHKEEINKAYLDFIGMNNEEFNKKFNEADAEQKKEILQKMQQFRNHYIEQHYDVNTVLNARLHERNATMASRIAQKTNAVQTPEHVNHPLKNFVKANPKIMKGIKDAAISMGVFATAGVAGITALSVYKFGEATLDSYRRFKGIDTSQRKGLLNKIKGAKDDALDLIKNFKEFKAYIKNNPDERLALKKAGVTAVLSVGLAGFGAANGVLNNGIVGNMLTEGGKDLAAQASFVALRRAVLLGAGGLFAGQTVVLKNRQIAPKKAEMLAILARYTDANTPQGKGLLGKFFKPKSPAEAIYGKLTGMFASKEDPKLEAKLDALVPNLRPQDKARLMELSKEIIDMSRAKGIAVGGVGLGVAAAELSDHGGSHDAAQATPAPETPTATGTTGAPFYNWGENDNHFTFPGIPGANEGETQPPLMPGVTPEDVDVADATHSLEIQDAKNYEFAVNATPTPTYQELMRLGVLSEDKAHELMGGRSYIPSRVLNDFIHNDAKFTDEQAKAFNDFVNDHDARMAEFKADRALHDAANNHHGGGAHGGSVRGGDGAHDGAATTTPEVNLVEMTGKTVDAEVKRLLSGFEPAKVDEALKVYHEAMKSGNYDRATEILKAASKASGNDNFESSELFKMHRDHLNTIMGNAATHIDDMAAKVEPAGYTHQIQGSAHRTLFGYQKEQTAVPIDDDRPVSSPRAFGQAAQKLQEEMPNKSRFSLEDNQGNSAKVHIKNDGDMKIKGKYFDAEGNPYKQTTTIDAQTGIEESKYSGATVPGNTVGANGEDDVVVKAISHAKGRMQIIKDGAATTDEGGRTDLYDGGSSKHHDFYTVKYDESGKRIEVSAPMTEKAANAALKAYKESLTQGGK